MKKVIEKLNDAMMYADEAKQALKENNTECAVERINMLEQELLEQKEESVSELAVEEQSISLYMMLTTVLYKLEESETCMRFSEKKTRELIALYRLRDSLKLAARASENLNSIYS